MSLSITCRAVCDGCGVIVEREVMLNTDTAQGIMERVNGVTTTAIDIWSWCIPKGWLQRVAREDRTTCPYTFFHNKECLRHWLQMHEGEKELDELNHAVWLA